MAKNEEKRFLRVYKQSGTANRMEIWQDTVTGVQYLCRQSGYGGGITVLVDREGNPMIGSAVRTEKP